VPVWVVISNPFEVAKRNSALGEETPRKSSRGDSNAGRTPSKSEDLGSDGLVHISRRIVQESDAGRAAIFFVAVPAGERP
jgi:hypothetical protein